MGESAVEVLRATFLVLGTGGVFLGTGALILERRRQSRAGTHQDQREVTDPESQR